MLRSPRGGRTNTRLGAARRGLEASKWGCSLEARGFTQFVRPNPPSLTRSP